MSSASIATDGFRGRIRIVRHCVGVWCQAPQLAVSDYMKTFTEDIHCLATILSKGIDCLQIDGHLRQECYGRRVNDALNTAPHPLEAYSPIIIRSILGSQYPIMTLKRDEKNYHHWKVVPVIRSMLIAAARICRKRASAGEFFGPLSNS